MNTTTTKLDNSRRRELLGMSPLGCAMLEAEGGDDDKPQAEGASVVDDAAEAKAKADLRAEILAEKHAAEKAALRAEILAERNREINSRPMSAARRAELLSYSAPRRD